MKNKFVLVLVTAMLAFSLVACGSGEDTNKPTDEAGKADQQSENGTQATDGLSQCGEAFDAGDLSYNIFGVKVKEYEDTKFLMLNMEVFNNSEEDINFSPMGALTVFNENNEECDWNMMIGKLSGTITPNNKIKGEVAFEITQTEADSYVLHVGKMFEYTPAIAIKSTDIDKTFAEVFETAGVLSEYTIGVPVQSEGFEMLIAGASMKASDKENQEILLIDFSITNHASEDRTLGFEIAGVFTADGKQLKTAANDWTFTNFPIGTGQTETGIVSYYVEDGIREFYMTVKPDIKDFNRAENIVFNVE